VVWKATLTQCLGLRVDYAAGYGLQLTLSVFTMLTRTLLHLSERFAPSGNRTGSMSDDAFGEYPLCMHWGLN
jgi:hypothetical protein